MRIGKPVESKSMVMDRGVHCHGCYNDTLARSAKFSSLTDDSGGTIRRFNRQPYRSVESSRYRVRERGLRRKLDHPPARHWNDSGFHIRLSLEERSRPEILGFGIWMIQGVFPEIAVAGQDMNVSERKHEIEEADDRFHLQQRHTQPVYILVI